MNKITLFFFLTSTHFKLFFSSIKHKVQKDFGRLRAGSVWITFLLLLFLPVEIIINFKKETILPSILCYRTDRIFIFELSIIPLNLVLCDISHSYSFK